MNKEEIIKYIKDIYYKSKDIELKCEELSDGNINYVYRIYNSDSSIVVKYCDELLRTSGRPLDTDRLRIEKEALEIENSLCPNLVPNIYHYDQDKHILIMEDIGDYKNLRYCLMEGKNFKRFADHISTFLSRTLVLTSGLVLKRKDKRDNVKKFTNIELCDITEDLVLTEPYNNYKNRNIVLKENMDFVRKELYEDKLLHCEVGKLRDKYINNSQALLHGDLHTGSIFINEKGNIKVIDSEFSFYGPMGYDIGNVLANLIISLFYNRQLGRNTIELEETIAKVQKQTFSKIKKLCKENINLEIYNDMFIDDYVDMIFADSLGYCGTEIIRRVVGDSKVLEITSTKNKRAEMERKLIMLGKELIIQRHFATDIMEKIYGI